MVAKIFGFLLVATFCSTALACSCIFMTDNERYCKSDFVMKVRVISKLKIRGFEAFYRIRIKGDALKFRKKGLVDQMDRLYTGRDPAACGVTLKRKKYLISGFVDTFSKTMRINSCGSLVLAKSFYNFYKNNPPNCVLLDLPIRSPKKIIAD